jgi:hypothetical protein
MVNFFALRSFFALSLSSEVSSNTCRVTAGRRLRPPHVPRGLQHGGHAPFGRAQGPATPIRFLSQLLSIFMDEEWAMGWVIDEFSRLLFLSGQGRRGGHASPRIQPHRHDEEI